MMILQLIDDCLLKSMMKKVECDLLLNNNSASILAKRGWPLLLEINHGHEISFISKSNPLVRENLHGSGSFFFDFFGISLQVDD